MAIVFPASPSNNDTFTVGSITYTYDGSKWIGLGVTPTDRLIEGNNNLQITAGNELVWTGGTSKFGGVLQGDQRVIINGAGGKSGTSDTLLNYAGDGTTVTASLTADGAATFAGSIAGSSVNLQSAATACWFQTGTSLASTNYVWAAKDSSANVWHSGLQTDGDLYLGGNLTSANNIGLKGSDGSAFFLGDVGIGNAGPRTELDLFDGQLSFSHRTDYSIRFYNGTGNNWSSINNPSTNDGTSASTLAFRTAQGECLNLATNGEVTKPKQPGFIARYSVNDTTWNVASDGWTKIIFDEENMDRGSNFSTANSEFTAPVAGMYLFGAELQLEGPNGITGGYLTSGTNWMYIAFIVNGGTTLVESKGGTRTDVNFNAMYNSYTPTHLMQLNAGDKVCMYRTGNYTSIRFKGGPESVFWGYLVG